MARAGQVQLQPAYVLHHMPYRNTSTIVDLLTRDSGRMSAVARGARRPKSSLRGALEPFLPVLVSWTGRGELVTLTAAERAAAAPVLTGSMVMSGFYVNELLLRLLRKGDPHSEVFQLYQETLRGLVTAMAPHAGLRRFEKRLLEDLGYGLNLRVECDTGRPLDPGADYWYHLEEGPRRAMRAGGSLGFSGRSLLALADEQFDDVAVLADARRLLQAALQLYLGDRPLKTRLVAEAMRARSGTPAGNPGNSR